MKLLRKETRSCRGEKHEAAEERNTKLSRRETQSCRGEKHEAAEERNTKLPRRETQSCRGEMKASLLHKITLRPRSSEVKKQERRQESLLMGVGQLLPGLFVILSCLMHWAGVQASWEQCGSLAISSKLVPVGTPVTASCHLDAPCLQQAGNASPAGLAWTLDGEELPRRSKVVANETDSVVTIPRASGTEATFTCYSLHQGAPRLLGNVSYQVGAPPAELHILTCVVIWISNITCSWDPGQQTNLPTTYALHVREDLGRCEHAFSDTKVCHPMDRHRCAISITRMNAFYSIWVTAQNALGLSSSPTLCRLATDMVKLGPPEMESVTSSQRCLVVTWRPPADGLLPDEEAEYEVRYRQQKQRVDEEAAEPWRQLNFTATESEMSPKRLCSVSYFTNYTLAMRAKYQSSYSHWSDWSPAKTVETEQAAPSRAPSLWRRIATPDAEGRREVLLMWKPLKQDEANGRILGYHLLSQAQGEGSTVLTECPADSFRWTLSLSEEDHTILLTAYNVLGESPAVKLVIPAADQGDLPAPVPVLVSTVNDHALLVRWESRILNTGLTKHSTHVLEWVVVTEQQGSGLSHWESREGNITEAVVREYIEPGRLYQLSVYILHDGSIWATGSAQAYSRERPPLYAPKLHAAWIGKSQVELEWGDIPVEAQRGVIRNYSVFYQEVGGKVHVMTLNSSSRRCLLSHLGVGAQILAHLVITNSAGGTNSSGLTITTRNFDDGEVELLVPSLVAGVTLLLMAVVVTCMYQHRMIKRCLWPQVPDPAVTDLANWRPQSTWKQDLGYPPLEQTDKLQMRLAYPDAGWCNEISLAKQEDKAEHLDAESWGSHLLTPHNASSELPGVFVSPYSVPHVDQQGTPTPGPEETEVPQSAVEYASVVVQAYSLPQGSLGQQELCAYSQPSLTPRHVNRSGPSDPGPSSSLLPSLTSLEGSDFELPPGSPQSSSEFPLLRALLEEGSGPPHFLSASQLPET
ncbi:granulocyte colony-stimulating factor receptor-like [Lissotriton helveticus]